MDDNEILQPCPFCGGEAAEDYAFFGCNDYGVHCKECLAYVWDPESAYAARQKWNRRVN